MAWDVISNQWFWLGAAGFFMIALAIILIIARRPTGQAKKSQEGGWFPTGRIDFSGPNESDPDSSGNFILQAEDTRVVRSIGGIDHHEIRWRRATLNEAKKVVSTYHAQRSFSRAPLAGAKSVNKLASESEVESSPRVEAPSLAPSA